MKLAVEGLNKTILSQLNELYNDVKEYANREIMILMPKINGSASKCELLELNVLKNSTDVCSIRREINDRYDFISNKLDEFNNDLRDIKDKQNLCKNDILKIKDEIKSINETCAKSNQEN